MDSTYQHKPATVPVDLIAPCGMNCRLCWGYMRGNNSCPGCRKESNPESAKSKCRNDCVIRNCEKLKSNKANYCSDSCDIFPCYRLKQLDKRYRKKYGMSMISNLKQISEFGIKQFTQNEKMKWRCSECGEMICVHKSKCISCGHEWLAERRPTSQSK